LLPGGRFLYLSQGDGIYAGSFSKPAERIRLVITRTNALYTPGNDGESYLLWLRDETLFAQQFRASTLKLVEEPHPVANPVGRIAVTGQMNAAVSANGLLMYDASSASNQFNWFDRTGKSLGTVGEPGEYQWFRLSPDGHRAAVARGGPGGNDLWLLELDRVVASRFTSNTGATSPVWSPDGRTIVYRSGKSPNIFRKESSGAESEQRITTSPYAQFATDWSRDGRFLLYHELAPATGQDLWILPVTPEGRPAPGTEPRPYLRTPFRESWGRFSPQANPRWVAYQSDESGRYEVYVQAFPEPRGSTRISTGGGQYPEWGPDGRELFYVSPDSKLMAVSLKLGANSVEPAVPHELFFLSAAGANYSPYEVAPDGQHFLVRAGPQHEQPLTVIVNWPALLKKGGTAQ
jgi:hypothetical protein